jgi:hypothetical protein
LVCGVHLASEQEGERSLTIVTTGTVEPPMSFDLLQTCWRISGGTSRQF